MKNKMFTSLIAVGLFLLLGSMLNAQVLLDDDTLFIGTASGCANEHVVVPVHLKTTHRVQGWQVPILFGYGLTPVYCDSVSTVGTTMENWVFQAPFTNNYEWDNMQACGIAGVKDWMAGSIDPGYHLVMNLHFTIDDDPAQGTYVLDTTRASWYSGGPPSSYAIVVNTTSYITHVVAGSLVVTPFGIDEQGTDVAGYTLDIYPTVARVGDQIKVRHDAHGSRTMMVYDATGSLVANFPVVSGVLTPYSTNGLHAGIYFVTTEKTGIRSAQKIVLY
jgi:hypothetical protein